MTKWTTVAASFVLAAGVGAAVGGCAAPEGSGGSAGSGAELSRVRLYANVGELAADSKLVVTATVTSQSVADDIDPRTDFTISRMTILKSMRGSDSVKAGDEVVVRQLGSSEQAPPVPLLDQGQVYLLYLTPSGLTGKLAEQYYVTGANAGIYVQQSASKASVGSSAEGSTYVQVQRQNAENLPPSLSDSQAVG